METEHFYAVVTKRGRIQLLLQPTIKQLRKRGKRGWGLFSTVDNGFPDADPHAGSDDPGGDPRNGEHLA